jgi:glucan phosphoethanolaminetransferase (alkaline phosphatase superfamily)
MMQYTLILGILMFTHYGCAILKHDSQESDPFLKFALVVKLVCAVLIFRASYLEHYYDLLLPFIVFATICVALSFYLWLHGITFINTGKMIHKITYKDIANRFKRIYEIYTTR